MKFDNAFAVTAPLDEVWTTLMDFPRVTGCVPGASILGELSPDAYQVGMKVKLGPVSMQYRGQLEVLERDPAAHRAVLRGSAKEARGQGTAQATVQLQLVEDGSTTRGAVSADVTLSGRAAAMGQGVIGSVTDQMMAQFATNLQAMLAAEAAADGAGAPPGDPAAPPAAAPSATAPAAPPAAPPAAVAPAAAAPAPPAPAAPGAAGLDGLALARGVLVAQLRDPRLLAVLGVLAALVAHRAGRRSARREERALWAAAFTAVACRPAPAAVRAGSRRRSGQPAVGA